VSAVLATLDTGGEPDRAELRDAVRTLLTALRTRAPGRSVEVRVPPYGAIQCVEGPTHTRGTPPNVVETDPLTFCLLATGRLSWPDAIAAGRIAASGTRADLSAYFPLV
jgi:Bacterial SCP ortholog